MDLQKQCHVHCLHARTVPRHGQVQTSNKRWKDDEISLRVSIVYRCCQNSKKLTPHISRSTPPQQCHGVLGKHKAALAVPF